MVATGLTLFAAAGLAGLTGIDVTHVWLSLVLRGLGWNFSWLGASALVQECHRPAEPTRVPAFNDCVVFGMTAVGAFSAGGLLLTWGWDAVIRVLFFPLAMAITAIAFGTSSRVDLSVEPYQDDAS